MFASFRAVSDRRHVSHSRSFAFLILVCSLFGTRGLEAQNPLDTPLEQEVLDILSNEISGQIAFNNVVKLAGAPWIRDPSEFTDTFYESQELYDMVRGYGIETVRFDRYEGPGTYFYPTEAEFWIEQPERRLVARLGADVAMVAYGSQTADVRGELIYVPAVTAEELRQVGADGSYRGKIALMWSHPRGDVFEALDALGVQSVISFNSRERYLDPNQVVYSRGNYARGENLRLGITVSWRQWTELLEDVERGLDLVVRLRAQLEEHPNKFETIFAWIPGTEPDAKGVVFTGHLFEGYTKRGTNDDMGGPAIQLEILRALTSLIESGQIAQPRRTIYFIWPNEISGTYEFIRRDPDLVDRWSININMDMVSEALRKNNSLFTMSETPAHLPSYLDGLAKSMLNYVWRTNDIVYLPDSPRGRPGGQYFPKPMVEKNGSIDAFRFYIHEATGGSDHICFNNPSVAVPGIEFFTWPDQWYHADADLPDKADPTEMKRVAFIGAATALAAADLTDDRLPGLLDAVSAFGYARVAERAIPPAFDLLEEAAPDELQTQLMYAVNRVNAAVDREVGALESVREIYSATHQAGALLDDRLAQWELYRAGLQSQVVGYARRKASRLGAEITVAAIEDLEDPRYSAVIPAFHPSVERRQFYVERSDNYAARLAADPDAIEKLELSSNQTRWILNFVNGQRSVSAIKNRVAAVAGDDLTIAQVSGYLEILEEVGWIVWR